MNTRIEFKHTNADQSIKREKYIGQTKQIRYKNLKESAITQFCCTKHLQCIGNDSLSYAKDDQLSINSNLLVQIQPKNMSSQPLFNYEIKPEVDILAQINIKKKKYEKLLQQQQIKQKQEEKKKRVKNIQQQAKLALEKSKKISHTHQLKWGHSIFQVKIEAKEHNVKQNKKKDILIGGQRQKAIQKSNIKIKPIEQRIFEYKKQQILKMKSAENFRKPLRKDMNYENCKQRIQQNATKILLQKKIQKEKKKQEQNIRQAKIRAIQIQSLNNIKKTRKHSLQNKVQFQLGDSQYSTFEARAEGRKMQNKNKKIKEKKIPNPLLPQMKKMQSSKNLTKRKSNSKYQNSKINSKTNQKKQTMQASCDSLYINNKQLQRGPFFLWNMSIFPEDMQKLENSSNKVFINVDRFNYKQGKTFREETNDYLIKKMEKKYQQSRQMMKLGYFLAEVQRKKLLLKQSWQKDHKQIDNILIWNEDEIFRPNSFENFHFIHDQGV